MFSLQNKSTGAKFNLSLTENTFFNMGPHMGTLHLGCSAPPPSFCSTKCLILCYTIVPMIFKTNKQTKTLERNAYLWYLSGPSNPKSVGEITNASQTTT